MRKTDAQGVAWRARAGGRQVHAGFPQPRWAIRGRCSGGAGPVKSVTGDLSHVLVSGIITLKSKCSHLRIFLVEAWDCFVVSLSLGPCVFLAYLDYLTFYLDYLAYYLYYLDYYWLLWLCLALPISPSVHLDASSMFRMHKFPQSCRLGRVFNIQPQSWRIGSPGVWWHAWFSLISWSCTGRDMHLNCLSGFWPQDIHIHIHTHTLSTYYVPISGVSVMNKKPYFLSLEILKFSN